MSTSTFLPPPPFPAAAAPIKWQPLERTLGAVGCADFMFMGTIEQDGTTIYLYKHQDTRRYLNLDDAAGNAWEFVPRVPMGLGSSYRRINMADAINHAFRRLR
jgi:hypothetical protein